MPTAIGEAVQSDACDRIRKDAITPDTGCPQAQEAPCSQWRGRRYDYESPFTGISRLRMPAAARRIGHFRERASKAAHEVMETLLSATKYSDPGIPSSLRLPVSMLSQPDETTCGPTCLHAVYRYWQEHEQLEEVIVRTRSLEIGGTFAVFLACDALRKGYRATIYTYNLNVFDPSWFGASGTDISDKLRLQRDVKTDYRLQQATAGYLDFLKLGGRLRQMDLSHGLIHGMLRRRLPILTGLSSTYLYRTPREYGPDDAPDDIRGLPAGHFVVIAGYDIERHKVLIMDPYNKNPYGRTNEYWIGIDRVIGAILLGIVTHDANLLVIHPRNRPFQLVA